MSTKGNGAKGKRELSTRDQAEEFHALIDRIDKDKSDPKDLQKLRDILSNTPRLWTVYGDAANMAIHHAIDGLTKSRAIRENVRVGIEEIRADLGAAQASPLEKLLIDQIVLCWLHHYTTSLLYDRLLDNKSRPEAIAFADRWLSSTQRRYLRAVESLARVRRLLRPNALQVNIGAQQVNVSKGA